MDSPWGVEWSILKETGWTRNYLLWKISWANVRLMLADAPRFERPREGDDEVIMNPTDDDMRKIFG